MSWVYLLAGGRVERTLHHIGGVDPARVMRWTDYDSPDSSFSTAVSFMTNTNWQGYGGQSTMSYFTQMAALTVQNFLSAATGMAVAVAPIRGFGRQKVDTVANFRVDTTRSTLYTRCACARPRTTAPQR